MFARIAFVVTTTLLLGLAACSDDGPPDAAEIYADAGEAMAALTSYHVTVDGLEEGEAFLLELDLMLPDSFQNTITGSEGEEFFEFASISIGDDFYTQFTSLSSDWFIGSAEDRADFGDFLGSVRVLVERLYG